MHVHATLPFYLSFIQAHTITVTVTSQNTSTHSPALALLVQQYPLNFLQLAVNAPIHSLVVSSDVFTVSISPIAAVLAHLQYVLLVSHFPFTLELVYAATGVVTLSPPMEFAQNAEQAIQTANIAKRHMFTMDSNAGMDH